MQTIDRISQLLEFLSNHKDGIGINEISEKLDLPLSTTHRMLNGLKKNGYISQDIISKRYKLGVGILSLAIHLLNDMDIIKVGKPIIEDLSTKYGQLIFLSVLENDKVTCVDMVNNAERMRFYVQIGSPMPVHCSASGKSIVAYLDEDQINKFLENESRTIYTSYTKLETYEIKKELSMVKELGYAVCDEEMEVGVMAISTPIRGKYGDVYASITIMLIKQLQYDASQIIQDLKDSADKISKFLGYIE